MKFHVCLILTVAILFSATLLPVRADKAPSLALEQMEQAEPGQDVTLILSLPVAQIAGGFMRFSYDASLFILKSIDLCAESDALTLTYHEAHGSINVLLDAAQNVPLDGALLSLTFATSEEAQPGTYPIVCTVPDAASFYTLDEDGSAAPLHVGGCQGTLTLTAPALPACPARYLACQETNPKDGKITVRLCALVAPDASLSRGTYGFVVSVRDSDGTRELTLGGSAIADYIDGGGKTYTAAELGGNVYTATLTVPDTGEAVITLTPYVRLDGQTLYAGTYTVYYLNGAYTGTSNETLVTSQMNFSADALASAFFMQTQRLDSIVKIMVANAEGIFAVLHDPGRSGYARIEEIQHRVRQRVPVQAHLCCHNGGCGGRLVNRTVCHGRELRAVLLIEHHALDRIRKFL